MKNISTKLLLCVISVLLYVSGYSQFATLAPKSVFIRAKEQLNYRLLAPFDLKEKYHFEEVLAKKLFVPIGEDTAKYPLIIFLHGSGERGAENERQLIHIDSIFADDDFQKKYPCFVLAPQCPEEQKWVEVDWDLDSHTTPEKMSKSFDLLNDLIDSLIKQYPIDDSRIYLMGLSMGGYGTWDFISRFPKRFAAAVPICGGGDEKMAETIKDVPIWAFHGALDKLVKPLRSQNMINAIKKYGGQPKYTEYKNLGHLCWNAAFTTPELYEWMFAQKLKK